MDHYPDYYAKNFNMTYEHMGQKTSFVEYGPAWAMVSMTPFSNFKSSAGEGGVRAPFLISYPKSIPAGQRTDAFASVVDVAGDLSPCFFAPKAEAYAFVPNAGIDKASLQAASAKYNPGVNPKTFAFFRYFREKLEKRSTYKTRMKGAPFFSVYNVGEYTFAPYKVVWAEMTGSFCAAVVTKKEVPGMGMRPYVPDHKLYFADFEDEDTAYFLCGLLHSEVVKNVMESHLVSTSTGDIFKHVSLPKFNPQSPLHEGLVKQTKAAHAQPQVAERAKLVAAIVKSAGEIIQNELQKGEKK